MLNVGGPILVLFIGAVVLAAVPILLGRFAERRAPTPRMFDHSIARSRLPQLGFRKPEHRDIDQIVRLAREPHTMAANRWGPVEAEKHEAFLRSDRFETFASVSIVAELASGEIVGVGSLDLRPETSEPSIGIHIAQAHGEQGFGTELMSVMITLTQHMAPGGVWVGTAVDNYAMQSIMDKLGYEPEPGSTAFRGSDGSIVESIWYPVGTSPF